MTLDQLEHLYNFHDCDVFTPFEINGDSVIVAFDLAKHLQYDDLKSRYGDLLHHKDNHLIMKAKFSHCSALQVSEWQYRTSKATDRKEKCNEHTISAEQLDPNADFISLAVLSENKICFTFEKHGNPKKYSEVQFVCQTVDILEERIYTDSEYDMLYE